MANAALTADQLELARIDAVKAAVDTLPLPQPQPHIYLNSPLGKGWTAAERAAWMLASVERTRHIKPGPAERRYFDPSRVHPDDPCQSKGYGA